MSYDNFSKTVWCGTASFLKRASCAAISFYQKSASPWLGHHCRFEPSCSEYAKIAIQEHGLVRGIFFGAKRIVSCHPWNRGGYDPVPATNQAGAK